MSNTIEEKVFLENVFNILAPGTLLRKGIDRIQEASLGALIVLSGSDEISHLIDGGFVLNTEFTPQKIYELSKMDGAILISRDLNTILGANIQMQPNSKISTDESGTRHRTAHRIAQETNNIVITVSERRNKITVFQGKYKYMLVNLDDLLIKSSQALSSLEKYAEILNKYLYTLNYYEIEETVTLEEVISSLRHFSLLFAMEEEVKQYILELGEEGRLLQLQYQEIMDNQENVCKSLIKDYYNLKKDKLKLEKIFKSIVELDEKDRYDNDKILSILGYDKNTMLEKDVTPKGYRFLSNIQKITKKEIDQLIDYYKDLPSLLNTNYDELMSSKLLSSKVKVERIIKSIHRYKNQMEIYKGE